MVSKTMIVGIAAIIIIAIVALAVLTLGPTPTPSPSPTPTPTPKLKVAMIVTGSPRDLHWSYAGFLALARIKERFGIETAFSEYVAVADAERVAREYIAAGYNVIIFHGAEFIEIVKKLAPDFPEIVFVHTTGGMERTDYPPGNVWQVAYYGWEGYYPLGVLAAKLTNVSKVGVIMGVETTGLRANLNGFIMGARSVNPNITILYIFTGDWNDPVRAKQAAESLIAEGVDVIFYNLNLAQIGVHEAVRASGKRILLMNPITDHRPINPDLIVTSLIYDFDYVYPYVIQQVMEGKKEGVIVMRVINDLLTFTSLKRGIPEDAVAAFYKAIEDIKAGRVTVPFIGDRILG